MNKKCTFLMKVLALLLLSVGLVSCDGSEPEDADGGSDRDILTSRQAFDAAMTKSGTAKGSAFSGTFFVVFSDGRFSKDCTIDFVREADFYVNDSAPDDVIRRLLDEVRPPYPVTIQVQQQDGRVTLDADGDGIEGSLTGSIDADGTFLVVGGTYLDAKNYLAAYHSGRIQGERISGAFAARVTLEDEDYVSVAGSCTWSADISPSE